MNTPRDRLPFSQKQMVNLRHFASLGEVDGWLNDLVSVNETPGEAPYYLHIDHVQVFPPNAQQMIPVLTIYHRVYLQRGS